MTNRADLPPILPTDLQDAESFVASLAAVYGAACSDEILRQMAHSRGRCFWLNPLVCPASESAETLATLQRSFAIEPFAHLEGMWCVSGGDRDQHNQPLTHSSAAESGKIYFQNPSSVFAVRVLDPQPGEEILDLAAAPGGKTLAIAAAMDNHGRIAAVEPVKARFHRMRANLDRCGVTITEFYLRDGRGVGRAVPERFDRVLLDAPCSSQARMRWDDRTTYQHWNLKKIKEAQRKQKSLIRSAYAALKPGGVLVYSTCSFSIEENELVVNHLLNRVDAELLEIDAPDNSIDGVTNIGKRQLRPDLEQTKRIVPEGEWDGFYIARIRKLDELG